MNTVEILYEGDLRTRCKHMASGVVIGTDAPVDNKGLGQNFSPTDLLATALGTCMLTIMGIAAAEHGLDIRGTKVHIKKHMASGPRRVAQVDVDIFLPDHRFTPLELKILKVAAKTCPVSLSLSPELVQNLNFHIFN